MTIQEAVNYAVNEIPNILPLDEAQIRDLCEQTVKQSNNDPELIAQSFFDILGQDDSSVHFIFEFNERLMNKAKPEIPAKKDFSKADSTHATAKQKEKKIKSISPSIGSLPAQSQTTSKNGDGNANILPESIKHEKKSTKPPGKDAKAVRLDSLQDIDDVLKMLEVKTDFENPEKYKCNCQASRHQLFEPAPNCLKCGKIICIKEGLHFNTCSFCGNELIPSMERERIVELLHLEKDKIEAQKIEENRPKERKKKTYKITSGGGINLWKEQENLLKKVEKDREQERESKRQQILGNEDIKEDEQLTEARERLEKLLHFQDTSAERTKIIDNASDFSMSEEGIWGSAYERALQLKKQQRNLRKWEKMERERNGRREKIVLDLTIGKDGKAVMTEVVKKSSQNPHATSDDDMDDISDEEDLQDLDDIRNLKTEINQQKAQDASKLNEKVWDYNKVESQFSKPEYIGEDSIPGTQEAEKKLPKHELHRVQVGINDKPTLQDEILAIL